MNRKTKKLIDQLDHKDPKQRYDAVLQLGKMGDIELIGTLDRVANLDGNAKVRDLASKAVRTLEVLRSREEAKFMEAQIASGEVDIAVSDDPLEWPELMKEKMHQNREFGAAALEDDFNYVESKKRERERKELDARRKAAEEAYRLERDKLARARRRRPFRLFLLFATFVVAILGIFVVWYRVVVDPPPESRREAVEALEATVADQEAFVISYNAALTADPIDCDTILELDIPEVPRWVTIALEGDTAEEPSGFFAFSERAAKNISTASGAVIADLDPAMIAINTVNVNLRDAVQDARTACRENDPLLAADWVLYNRTLNTLGNSYTEVSRAANEIQSQSALLPPTTRDEALEDLQQWLDVQTFITNAYRNEFASEFLDCALVVGVEAPTPPSWIATNEVDAAITADLDLVVEALQDVNTRLGQLKIFMDNACAGVTGLLPRAEWAQADAAAQINEQAVLEIEAVQLILDAAKAGTL